MFWYRTGRRTNSGRSPQTGMCKWNWDHQRRKSVQDGTHTVLLFIFQEIAWSNIPFFRRPPRPLVLRMITQSFPSIGQSPPSVLQLAAAVQEFLEVPRYFRPNNRHLEKSVALTRLGCHIQNFHRNHIWGCLPPPLPPSLRRTGETPQWIKPSTWPWGANNWSASSENSIMKSNNQNTLDNLQFHFKYSVPVEQQPSTD